MLIFGYVPVVVHHPGTLFGGHLFARHTLHTHTHTLSQCLFCGVDAICGKHTHSLLLGLLHRSNYLTGDGWRLVEW